MYVLCKLVVHQCGSYPRTCPPSVPFARSFPLHVGHRSCSQAFIPKPGALHGLRRLATLANFLWNCTSDNLHQRHALNKLHHTAGTHQKHLINHSQRVFTTSHHKHTPFITAYTHLDIPLQHCMNWLTLANDRLLIPASVPFTCWCPAREVNDWQRTDGKIRTGQAPIVHQLAEMPS